MRQQGRLRWQLPRKGISSHLSPWVFQSALAVCLHVVVVLELQGQCRDGIVITTVHVVTLEKALLVLLFHNALIPPHFCPLFLIGLFPKAKKRRQQCKLRHTQMTELTILMPCLNEAETLEACITKAIGYMRRAGVNGEVLIADNGSTDGSQALAESLGARVVHVPVRGYGAALGVGIKAARGRYVIMGDSDDSYDFSNLDPFMHELRKGADLVMGNRFKGGIARNAMPPLHRYLGNPVLSTIGRVFFRAPVGDFHCGLRGFSRDAILGLKLNTPGMEFASEMVIQATVMGLKIKEVPTTLSPDGRSRPPHLRSWRDGWLHLKLLLTFAPHWLFYYPGMALLAVGTFIFISLLGGPITIGAVTFDIASLILASALILIGFQLACFYGLARLHSVKAGLLPSSERFERLAGAITVDRACQVGALLLLAGFSATIGAFVIWNNAGWGDLNPSVIARPAAFAVVCASLGIQATMAGFLWGLLGKRFGEEQSVPADVMLPTEG